MVADQLDEPRPLIGRSLVAAQVQRRDRERRQGDGENRSLKARPAPLGDGERHEQRSVGDGQEQQSGRRRRLSAERVGDVHDGGDAAG